MFYLLVCFICISSQTIPEIQTETRNKINSFYNKYIITTKIDSFNIDLLVNYFR